MLKRIVAIRKDDKKVITAVQLKIGTVDSVPAVITNIKNKCDQYITHKDGQDGETVAITYDRQYITTIPNGNDEYCLDNLPTF